MPIFELRVFAEQKRRQGFLPLTSVSACGTGWATKNPPNGFLVALWISFVVYQIPRKARKIASVDVFLEMDALPHEKKGVCVISRVLLSQSDIGII